MFFNPPQSFKSKQLNPTTARTAHRSHACWQPKAPPGLAWRVAKRKGRKKPRGVCQQVHHVRQFAALPNMPKIGRADSLKPRKGLRRNAFTYSHPLAPACSGCVCILVFISRCMRPEGRLPLPLHQRRLLYITSLLSQKHHRST